MHELILSTDELLYLQKAATLFDIEKSKFQGYNSQDKEFSRQLMIKLLSTERKDQP